VARACCEAGLLPGHDCNGSTTDENCGGRQPPSSSWSTLRSGPSRLFLGEWRCVPRTDLSGCNKVDPAMKIFGYLVRAGKSVKAQIAHPPGSCLWRGPDEDHGFDAVRLGRPTAKPSGCQGL